MPLPIIQIESTFKHKGFQHVRGKHVRSHSQFGGIAIQYLSLLAKFAFM